MNIRTHGLGLGIFVPLVAIVATLVISSTLFVGRVEAAPNYTSCTKYVSPSGSVNGNTAYTTLQAGVNVLVPGDTLCVAPGTYREKINVNTSGTASNPITIRALDSANKPLIDGEYRLPTGTPGNYDSGPTGGLVPCLEYWEDPNANRGPEPKQACFVYGNLVTIKASYLTWDGINLTRSRGIGMIVGDNRATGYAYSNVKVLNTDIGHTRHSALYVYQAENIIIEGGSFHNADDFAIYSRGAGGVNWPGGVYFGDVRNVDFINNDVYRNFGEGLGMGLFDMSYNVRVIGNRIYDNYALGIYVNNNENSLVEGNLIYHSGDSAFFRNGKPASCMSVVSETGHRVVNAIIRNNIIAGCNTLISMYQHNSRSVYSNIQITNNTLLNPYTGGNVITSTYDALNGFTFANNLIYAPGATMSPGFRSFQNGTIGNNIWSSAPPAVLSGSGDIITSTPGITAPSYRPAVRGNYDATRVTLTSGSSAINAGRTISGTRGDYFGGARPNGSAFDIGAHEFGSTPGTVSPAPTPGTPPPTPSTCTNQQTSTASIPTGYGASYNPLTSAREYLVSVACGSGTTGTVTAGNGNPLTYVYNRGYYWTGSTWTAYTLSCASGALIGGAWCPGRATASIPLPQNPTNVIAYTCQYTNSTWKCGCRDAACSTAYWQLQRVGR